MWGGVGGGGGGGCWVFNTLKIQVNKRNYWHFIVHNKLFHLGKD